MKKLLALLSLLAIVTPAFASDATPDAVGAAVQTLMRNEAAFAAKVKAFAAKEQLQSLNLNIRADECGGGHDGGGHGSHFRCVRNCTWRSNSDGSCLSYGSDFCGDNASCTESCTWRSNNDGSCLSYDADLCS